MEAVVEKVGAQLKLWGAKIDGLAARAEKAGSRARFEDLIYVDELKALHVIALSKLEELKTAGETRRTDLKVGVESARDELETAIKKSRP